MVYRLFASSCRRRAFTSLVATGLLAVAPWMRGDQVYKVQPNDTLTGIARTHGVSVTTLAKHNSIPADTKLKVGQQLRIPDAVGSTGSAPSGRLYAVRSGDTLSELARDYGLGLTRLARYNGLRTDAKLRIGQKLRIPESGGFPKTASPHTLSSTTLAALRKARVKPGRWKHVVLHHSGTATGSVAGMDRYHRETRHMENGLAYHFVIGNGKGMGDGEVAVGGRWTKQLQGGHLASESLNQVSIGICLVGNFDTSSPTPKQLASLSALVDVLLERCGLPRSAVKTHQQINPVATRCPGRRFASSTALRRLQAR